MPPSTFLAPPFKLTAPVDWPSAIRNHVSQNFSDPHAHPDAIAADINKLHSLRKECTFSTAEKSEVHLSLLNKLLQYHAQLVFLATKFPVHIAEFPWYALFAKPSSSASALPLLPGNLPSHSPISLRSLIYERICILMNAAIMYMALGMSEKSDTPEGNKRACHYFQSAAGIFSFISDTLLTQLRLAPTDTNPCSPDLSKDCLAALSNLSLAQAQECFWQRALMDRKSNGVIAKLAMKVSEFYSEALDAANSAKGAGGVWLDFAFLPEIIAHITYKKYHFAAAAQWRKSCDDSGANRYGDELGRLHVAQDTVKLALKVPSKGVAPIVVDDAKSLLAVLTDNIARATKDNTMIYLEAITSPPNLPAIVSVTMAKPLIQVEVSNPISKLYAGSDGLGAPLFGTLVPYSVHMAVSIYDDRKESFVRDELVSKRDELNAISASTLEELNLPGSIQALEIPTGLPPSLLSLAEEMKQIKAMEQLQRMVQDVYAVATTDRNVLQEIYDLIASEKKEDASMRKSSPLKGHPPSADVNAALIQRANTLKTHLQTAEASDETVNKKLEDWQPSIELLCGDVNEMEAAIPSTAFSSQNGASNQLTRQIRIQLEDLDDITKARQRIIDDAKRFSQGDEIREEVLRETAAITQQMDAPTKIETSHFEPLFNRRLKEYNRFRETMKGNQRQQETLLQSLRDVNSQFVRARQDDQGSRDRQQALQSLDVAYHKYHEIHGNLAEALQFYRDVGKFLAELRDQTRQWVHMRRTQAQSILAAQMEAARISEAPSPAPSTPARTSRPSTSTNAMTPGQWRPGDSIKFA